MRKLASVKTISNIVPILGKDKIALATVDGWSVIVKKDEFNIGDLCVYIEIDSVLPQTEQFEFLSKCNYRIKTMKMAGVISQGICFPLSILPKANYNVDQDVSDIIGVKQYEPTMDKEQITDIKFAKQVKYPKFLMRFKLFRQWVYKQNKREGKGFPSFISKTDEARIQNMPFILQNKDYWVATEKLDGQSGTFVLVKRKSILPFIKNKYDYIVCSRNLRLYNKDNSSYWNVSDRYNIELLLKKIIGNNEWVAIQGECLAPNVQSNKYKVDKPDLYVFNVIYPTGRISSLMAKKLCESLGLKFVPIISDGMLLPQTVEECLNFAHGKSAIGNTLREGVVFRAMDGKQSFKAVDPLFLIKYNE